MPALEHCPNCRGSLPQPPAPAICRACGWEATVPDPATWPRAFKAMLWRRFFREMLCAAGATERQGWERLLTSCYRGTTIEVNGVRRMLKWAATPAECYAAAIAEYDAQSASAAAPLSPGD